MRSDYSTTGQIESTTFIEAARRTQIIQCAIEAIAEAGYERASLAEIAKRAQVSKGVISYHFTSKDDLIEQIVAYVYAQGAAFMVPRIQKETTASGALRALITTNLEFFAQYRQDVMALVEIVTSSRLPSGELRFGGGAQAQTVRDVQVLLQAGQDAGEFRPFSTQVMAVTIRAAIDALGPMLVADPDFDIAAYGAELAELFELATKKQGKPKKETKR